MKLFFLKMALTSEQWYNLGVEMGEVDNCMTRTTFILQSKYGKSNTRSCLDSIAKPLASLQSNLDDLICAAYQGITLPGYNINITDVFYNLNRYTAEEANTFVKHIRPLPKTLTPEEIIDIIDSAEYIKLFVKKVNEELFNNENKHVRDIRWALIKLDTLLEVPMMRYIISVRREAHPRRKIVVRHIEDNLSESVENVTIRHRRRIVVTGTEDTSLQIVKASTREANIRHRRRIVVTGTEDRETADESSKG